MSLYVLSLSILFYQVFIPHRVSFICDCTYEYVCNVSSPATEVEQINNNNYTSATRYPTAGEKFVWERCQLSVFRVPFIAVVL